MAIARNIIQIISNTIKNKYFIVMTMFVIWIVFLDNYNLMHQYKINSQVDKLKTQKEFYLSEIKKDSLELYKLKHNNDEQEKFARERFLMKKKNEDIFIIRKDD